MEITKEQALKLRNLSLLCDGSEETNKAFDQALRECNIPLETNPIDIISLIVDALGVEETLNF